MAMLSQEAKNELRTIYEEEFNEVLTDDEAEEMGVRLLRLVSILAGKTDRDTPEG